MHSNFPSDEMRQELAREFAYYQTYSPRKIPLQLGATEFADEVGDRVYTEWCMGEAANKDVLEHSSYNGEEYKKFLDDEIYFHLERRAKLLGLSSACASHVEYLNERARVVRALIRRATSLLDLNNGQIHDWRQNLRASLEEWIE